MGEPGGHHAPGKKPDTNDTCSPIARLQSPSQGIGETKGGGWLPRAERMGAGGGIRV